MGSKLRGDGVEFPDQTLQTTAASYNTTEVFYVSDTFTKPEGVTQLEVILVGGGGGGGYYECGNTDDTTNGGLSLFKPITNPLYELGTHIAEGGKGGWNATVSGQGGYLGEDGGIQSQLAVEKTVDTFNPYGQSFPQTYWEGGGQGGLCFVNNYRGGVCRWNPKYATSYVDGVQQYDASILTSTSADHGSWSGGGGGGVYHLYSGGGSNWYNYQVGGHGGRGHNSDYKQQTIQVNKNSTYLYPSNEFGSLTVGHKLTNEDNYNSSVYGIISQIVSDDENHWWIITIESTKNGVFVAGDNLYTWDSDENKTATSTAVSVLVTNSYPNDVLNAGLGFGWKLSGDNIVEETDTSKYVPYVPSQNPFNFRGGNGHLGGGGASPYPASNLVGSSATSGGGGGGSGSGGGGPYAGKGGTSGEIKIISLVTPSDELDYDVIIGKGGNGTHLNAAKNCGGGGGAQGICIIKY